MNYAWASSSAVKGLTVQLHKQQQASAKIAAQHAQAWHMAVESSKFATLFWNGL